MRIWILNAERASSPRLVNYESDNIPRTVDKLDLPAAAGVWLERGRPQTAVPRRWRAHVLPLQRQNIGLPHADSYRQDSVLEVSVSH